MEKKAIKKRSRPRRLWIVAGIIALLAAAGAGYFYWRQQAVQTPSAGSAETYHTAQVRRGSILLAVSGSGTLIAEKENALGFSTTGIVEKVNVQIGDTVQAGAVLAVLDGRDRLQAKVDAALRDLASAQKALAVLKQSGPNSLANAQLALAEAQKALAGAQAAVVEAGWQRCDNATTLAFYRLYQQAKADLAEVGETSDDLHYYNSVIVPAKNKVAQAYARYESCSGYTDYEVKSSKARLALAQAKSQQAQDTLDRLAQNNGVDPIALAQAEERAASAQQALEDAQTILAGATITAPYSGTILAVAGAPGDFAAAGGFITLADLSHPRVQFSVDASDLSRISIGQAAEIVFDALPERTFQGRLTQINPALQRSGSYKVITGAIQLDPDQLTGLDQLPKGLNGSVSLIQASAKDVLLVPQQAVRDLGDGTYAVFVVSQDGQPRLRVVEVGLKDETSVEIKSGLALGDVVTTGTIQTK